MELDVKDAKPQESLPTRLFDRALEDGRAGLESVTKHIFHVTESEFDAIRAYIHNVESQYNQLLSRVEALERVATVTK